VTAAWKYIEEHHEQYGVALFVIPMLVCALVVTGVGYCLAWVLQ
jgi:hypothetical protein